MTFISLEAPLRGTVEGLPTPRPIADLLPASLQEDEFCVRMVKAFDEVLAPVFATLDCFDSYLNFQLAPPDFLDWLASWVGVDIDETWSQERRRNLLQQAAVLYRIRGTAPGLAAHLRLYTGAGPEIEDSGGCSWSQTADTPLPGSASPHLTVRLHVEEGAGVRRGTVSRIIDASRPAHVPFTLELTVGGSSVEAPVEPDAGGAAAADAPGAVDLPGSDRIELAAQGPSETELDEGSSESGEQGD